MSVNLGMSIQFIGHNVKYFNLNFKNELCMMTAAVCIQNSEQFWNLKVVVKNSFIFKYKIIVKLKLTINNTSV